MALPYHCLGEFITCILSLVLCINIVASFSPYDLRHRLFLYADVATFLSALFNILSVFCIAYYKTLPLGLCTTTSTLYFVFLLMMPLFLSCYSVDLAFSSKYKKRILFTICYSIYIVYLIIVLINIKAGLIFKYDPVYGYVRGPLKTITYICTGIYGLISIISISSNRKSMAKRIFIVFLVHPLLSLSIISIQFFSPTLLLTGTSSFAALLLTYISIQSDLLEFDLATGLMTEKKLLKNLDTKKLKGVLYVISIQNMNIIQNNIQSADFNSLLLSIGHEFTKHFARNAYHISTNRFAGICQNFEQLKTIHDKITNFFDETNNSGGDRLSIPMDVYYSAVDFSSGDKSSETILNIINNILNKAILQQNHTLRICNPDVLYNLERKQKILEILKRELNLNSTQFQVWFQPIYSIKKGHFTHMEALSRLQDTEIGNIPPQEFIEVAENKGLIEKLGFVAFEKVCKFISENRDVVDSVSINFSVYQMVNPNVISNVLTTIAKFGLAPSCIIMEITESLFIENYALVRNNMIELAKAGIRFYLDDFGTGYSNLANVVNLPFSTIKVDRSLVLLMEDDENKEKFVRNLIDTFKDANVDVLVEGIETQSQNEIIQKTNADYIQGFLYSRPMPADKCIELLKK